MDKPLIFLQTCGTERHPRFVIAERGGTVWDGSAWTADPTKGLVFAKAEEAAKVGQDLQRQAYKDSRHLTYFSVPILIEVLSEDEILPSDVIEWLKRTMSLQCAYGIHGNGPGPDCCVLLNVDWSRFDWEPTDDSK